MLYSSSIQFWQPQLRWQQIHHPLLSGNKVEIWLCHLDTGCNAVSGNKILKLRYVLQQALQQNKAGIFTFGGAFSNHLAAVAAACQLLKLQSTAYVRTEQLDSKNPTLDYCRQRGMALIAIDRINYRQRHDPEFIARLQVRHPQLLAVPEGGSSLIGAAGFADLDFAATPGGTANLVCCATASGGTVAGLIANSAMPYDTTVLGLTVVKDDSLNQRIRQLLPEQKPLRQWQLVNDYVGAGYARFDIELLQFCKDMAQQQLYVEPVYTGKALAGLVRLVAHNKLSPTVKRISFFHTGGLQGLQGLHYRKLITATDLALLSGSMAD
ncbi:1-aminocyclopropane-1-carboxylate deaminase/D-cysteine desulfhydrase [Rheinheimera gaetbuli]